MTQDTMTGTADEMDQIEHLCEVFDTRGGFVDLEQLSVVLASIVPALPGYGVPAVLLTEDEAGFKLPTGVLSALINLVGAGPDGQHYETLNLFMLSLLSTPLPRALAAGRSDLTAYVERQDGEAIAPLYVDLLPRRGGTNGGRTTEQVACDLLLFLAWAEHIALEQSARHCAEQAAEQSDADA